MKNLILLITIISSIQITFAQDRVPGDLTQDEGIVINEAIEDMANGLYNPHGDNKLLIIQVQKKIKSELRNSEKNDTEEVIKEMILAQQTESIKYAHQAAEQFARLTTCEDAMGEKRSRESLFVENYSANKLDAIQDGIIGKTKQYTYEVFVNANLVGRYAEYVIKTGNCMSKLRELVKKAKTPAHCESNEGGADSNEGNVIAE